MKYSRIKLRSPLIILLLLLQTAAFAQAPVPYTLTNEKGIWVEHFDRTYTKKNRFTENNVIYPEAASFTYRYYYLDKNGHKYLQKITPKAHPDREKAWNLVPLKQKDSLTHDRLQLIVEADLQGIPSSTPGFKHTPIRYEYFAPAGQLHFLEYKSLVENKGNIWLQPPTARLFRILALNPFPFIKAPYVVGNSWHWQQEVAPFWGDHRWKEWSSPVTNEYRYNISKEETLATPFGLLNCLVVEASAHSSLGSTALLAYFHPRLGFVKLLFTNIDGSQLVMELLRLDK